jgi:hypothetical protein
MMWHCGRLVFEPQTNNAHLTFVCSVALLLQPADCATYTCSSGSLKSEEERPEPSYTLVLNDANCCNPVSAYACFEPAKRLLHALMQQAWWL